MTRLFPVLNIPKRRKEEYLEGSIAGLAGVEVEDTAIHFSACEFPLYHFLVCVCSFLAALSLFFLLMLSQYN